MTANPTPTPRIPPLCDYIFPDTHRCGSPALRGESRCYHHHPTRKPIYNPTGRIARRAFTFNPPRDRRELQRELYSVMTRLAANTLDVRRAGMLLYSLQLAARDLP